MVITEDSLSKRKRCGMKLILVGEGYRNKNDFEGEEIIGEMNLDDEEGGGVEAKESDFVVICSGNADIIKKNMMLRGITASKLMDYSEWSIYRRRIVLLSHELTNTGAPAVLFYFAKILKENGFSPTVVSLVEGKLRKNFEELGIPVIIEGNINNTNERFWNWLKGFHTIVLNTLIFSEQIDQLRGCHNNVVWWLHEGEDIYTDLSTVRTFRKVDENFRVVSAGDVATRSFKKFYHSNHISPLYYGIPDIEHGDKKLVFALIGAIQPRKAQDLFINAIKCIPQPIIDDTEFWIVGRDLNEKFAQELRNQSRHIKQIVFKGEIPLKDMQYIYDQVDVLVCPSRIDTMPVVVTEAFKNKIPCIISEKIGQAELMIDGKEGVICRQEDYQNLAEKIVWMYENRDQLVKMGDNARKLYEKYFSMEAFEKNILKLV